MNRAPSQIVFQGVSASVHGVSQYTMYRSISNNAEQFFYYKAMGCGVRKITNLIPLFYILFCRGVISIFFHADKLCSDMST